MTDREEAIKWLENEKINPFLDHSVVDKYLNLAISSIKQVPKLRKEKKRFKHKYIKLLRGNEAVDFNYEKVETNSYPIYVKR